MISNILFLRLQKPMLCTAASHRHVLIIVLEKLVPSAVLLVAAENLDVECCNDGVENASF